MLAHLKSGQNLPVAKESHSYIPCIYELKCWSGFQWICCIVLEWSGLYCKYRNTVAVFVGGGFKMQKYRNTAVVFAPFFGAQVSTLKKTDTWAPVQLGPRTDGPQIDVGAQLQTWYLSNILHISNKYEKLPKIIISRQFQHLNPEKFEQISLFMWNLFFP